MSNSLLKICVYSLDDSYNFIGISDKDNNCIKPGKKDSFKLDFSFFAVNSIIRPIPYGMQLIGVFRSTQNSNAAGKLHIVYDLYNTKFDKTQTYFAAYIGPIIGTKPLYIWENASIDSTYLTFDKNYQPNTTSWQRSIISPIYVFDKPDLTFTCNNFRCIPYNDSKNIFNNSLKYDNLDNCLSSCALKGRFIDDLLTTPTLIDVIRKEEPNIVEKYENNSEVYNKNYNIVIITLLSIICTVILMAIFYCIYRK